eukprot:CAMPEP_0174315012 /NCGR_PEP_ID=MMETSP0810-20121108/6004_1 /TAXON_ID=73025 ORGANISM="Eutreptiella gymnastica-like, Strain CCMP1594" /NCGR_SAMPLE_ID=MMETSP0810 /ASSEMBLY_ACC=CAM_ASM_000659 /LENGTH=704 /DNA_ID=CAMNT_0015424259 /DNA_START=55 /DNA_END=2169 /DNA_ORIENTATION=+
MSSSSILSATTAMRSFWQHYRFKDCQLETKFKDRYQQSVVRPAQVWCLLQILLQILGVVVWLGQNFEAGYYWSHLPLVLIALICVASVTFAPKYATEIISVAAVLAVTSQGFSVHLITSALVRDAEANPLENVFEVLKATNLTAADELQHYVTRTTALSTTNLQCAFSFPQLLVLAYVGFSKSTSLALILMPLVFGIVLCVSPLVPNDLALSRSAASLVIVMFFAGLCARHSLLSRCSFFSEQSFETALNVAVQASRKADSILNHKLKNTMADAVGDIDMFIEDVEKVGNVNPQLVVQLKQAGASLRRGMKSCRHRQVYLQLAANDYKLSLQPVHLQKFAMELTTGRHVRLFAEDVLVLIDPVLCELIVDNLISNAFVHGHPNDPDVEFRAMLRPMLTAEENRRHNNNAPGERLFSGTSDPIVLDGNDPRSSLQRMRLTLLVSNAKNPARPEVTEDYVKDVVSGKAVKGPSTSAMSDHIGLQHSFMAADTLGMTLSLKQRAQRVTAKLEGDVIMTHAGTAVRQSAEADLQAWPENLKIYCIDDSAPARRLLFHNLTKWAATPNVRTYGQNEGEAARFIKDTVNDADIVILDQHLEYGGEANILGTDLVAELVAKRFTGLICMRSANVADEDVRAYWAAGAHCVFGKDMLMKDMIQQMKREYLHRGCMTTPALPPCLADSLSSEALQYVASSSLDTADNIAVLEC